MTSGHPDGTTAAMGPRLRAARERHGSTLAGVSCATGIAPSTLSRIETGRRKPTLEVLLRLAEEYGVSLDYLAGTAPAPAPERPAPARRTSGDGKTVLPLTPYVGGLHAHKHVLPAVEEEPNRPRQVSHEGHEWLCVLYGRLRLALGSQDLVLAAGDVAEFDTRTPHGVANAGPGTPVEYLVLFGPQGEQPRPRTPPVPGPGVHQGLSGPRPRDSTGAPTSSTAPASSPRPDSGSDHDRCSGAS